jgi:hypothetical protein
MFRFKVGLHGLKKGSHSVGLHKRKSSLKEIWSLEVVRGFLSIILATRYLHYNFKLLNTFLVSSETRVTLEYYNSAQRYGKLVLN